MFGRKKSSSSSSRPFKDYYREWIARLETTLLPLLRRSMLSSPPTLLATHVSLLHRHFLSYYDALDSAASLDVSQLLYPLPWRNSLELPFLWLGDFHPYLLTNLLRSFLLTNTNNFNDNNKDEDPEEEEEFPHCNNGNHFNYKTLLEVSKNPQFFDKPWQLGVAWKNPSKSLTQRFAQVERGLRLMVPAVAARAREAQAALLGKLAAGWVGLEGGKREEAVGEAIRDHIEEMVGVFVHANRLRRSVLAEVASVMDVYQAGLFFEGLAQFVVGFKDPELVTEFERCKITL